MIKTLEELIQYNEFIADQLDYDAKDSRLHLSPREIPGDQLREIKRELNLPESYIDVIRKVNLHDKAIGYFSISPAAWGNQNIIDNLRAGNEEGCIFVEECKPEQLIVVASMNEYGFAVATRNSPHYQGGEVVMIEEGRGILCAITRNFAQFLLIIGNMHQKHLELKKDEANLEEKRQEFMDILKKLHIDPKYQRFWREFF